MKKVFAYVLIAVFLCPVFVFASKNSASQPDKSGGAKKEVSNFDAYKDVLYKLVKQDELLDEALERSKTAKLDEEYIKYISDISVLIRKNLNEAAALNKAQLAYVSAGSQTEKYTRTIMVYANKIDRKVRALSAGIEKRYSAAQYRNAPVSSKKGVKGKKLSQILKEQEKAESLRKNLASLKNASGRVKATGKWLYIASK